MLKLLASKCHVVRANYYTTLIEQDDGHIPAMGLSDWLAFHGYNVISHRRKSYGDDTNIQTSRTAIAVAMTVDMLEFAAHVEHVILIAGQGDFIPVVRALQRRGIRVTLISTTAGEPSSIVSEDLRRIADNFIDLEDIAEQIEREPRHEGA